MIDLYILIFKFLDRKLEDKRCCTEWWLAFSDFDLWILFSRGMSQILSACCDRYTDWPILTRIMTWKVIYISDMVNQTLSYLFHFWLKLRLQISGRRTQDSHCLVWPSQQDNGGTLLWNQLLHFPLSTFQYAVNSNKTGDNVRTNVILRCVRVPFLLWKINIFCEYFCSII
jgi:hypothetical protein